MTTLDINIMIQWIDPQGKKITTTSGRFILQDNSNKSLHIEHIRYEDAGLYRITMTETRSGMSEIAGISVIVQGMTLKTDPYLYV